MIYKVDINSYDIEPVSLSSIDVDCIYILKDDGYVYIISPSDRDDIYIDLDFDFDYYYNPSAKIRTIRDNVVSTIRSNTINDILQ